MDRHEVAGDTRKDKRRRHMIDQLTDHFIICGYGRVGRRAAEEFEASGQAFAVLDTGDEAIEVARERGVLYRRGSGSDDRRSERAGIERARGLLASRTPTPRTSTSRSRRGPQRPELTIVARASTRGGGKLLFAGANRVVQPYAAAGTEMAKLALKPQVAASWTVSSHAGPDLRFEEIEVTGRARGGKTIRELRIRSTTGAVVIALRKPDGFFDVTPSPTSDRRGRRLIAIGTEPELKALEDLLHRGRWLAPLRRLEAALSAWRRRGDARAAEGRRRTATTRRTSRCRRARRRRPAARGCGGARRDGGRLAEIERAEVAGPGFLNLPGHATSFSASCAGEIDRATAAAARSRPRAHPGRDGLREPDRADHGGIGRNGALGDSVARLLEFAGHEVEREYYYNDAGAQMDRFRASVEAVRRGRGAARGRLPGRLHRRASPPARRPGAADAPSGSRRSLERFRIHFDSWAKQSELESESSTRSCRGCRPTSRTARPSSARRDFGDDKDRVLIRSAGRADADLRGRRHRLPARQARARLRPRDLRSRRRPPRRRGLVRGGRADARLRPGPRRGAALPARPSDARRRAGEDVEAPGRRRLPRRVHRRGRSRLRALVPRRPRPRPVDRDRRRPRRRALAQEPRLLRPVRPRADQRHLPRGRRGRRASTRCRARRSRRRSASSSSASPSSPRSSREATERRGPHAIPSTRSGSPTTSTASTTTTSCWPRRAASTSRSGLRSSRATRDVVARCLDLVGVDAPERM